MSTRSMIGIENSDGSIQAIYCHSDGYVEYVGWMLYSRYNTEEKLKKLISLGDISSIGPRIGKKIDYDSYWRNSDYYNANRNQVVAYHRDRGEPIDKHNYKDKSDYAASVGFGIEFIYLYSNGVWYVRKPGHNTRYCSLEKRLRYSEMKNSYDMYVIDKENNYTATEKKDFKEAYLRLFPDKVNNK